MQWIKCLTLLKNHLTYHSLLYPISVFFRLSSMSLLSSSIFSSSHCLTSRASCSFFRRVAWEREKKCFKNTSTKSCFTAETLCPGSEYLLLPQLQLFHLFAKFFSPLPLLRVPFLLSLFHPLQRLFSGSLVLVFKASLLLLRCRFLLHVQREMGHSQQVSKLSQLCTMLMGLSRVDFRPDTVLTADRSTVWLKIDLLHK